MEWLLLSFLIALATSICYAANLLVSKQAQLRGAAFWPPVVALSLMNACSEEIMYRLALYRMIRRAGYSDWTASIVQSLAYAFIHFMVVGAVFGLLSLIYGYLLGLLVKRCNSIGPAIVCHFVIDIGCIGMPLLRIYPNVA